MLDCYNQKVVSGVSVAITTRVDASIYFIVDEIEDDNTTDESHAGRDMQNDKVNLLPDKSG